ncbi:uncharacterized protein FOMMEDRAFT_158657 [Fomitiporia mediterranea MF3/22]|uniref:uncharacterized protein n=1 Tax=Fomitiporia mediterranea (strain MF3/22) TaxID=694068 RepID=UPI000440853C|nr:uncharacterized protein FOMMEDRAFT_158657 [Fomitiporia mediterranea MF3/22]EJD01505.1 hypothetical protein FOMMEDRAFT_158657 [Fomitiporia mediterranea MF3/22]
MIALSPNKSDSESLSDYALEKACNTPRVELLQPEHLDKLFESLEAAFKEDPVALYIKAGKERTPNEEAFYKKVWKFLHRRAIKRKMAYTINAGDAAVIATPPEGDVSKPSPIEHTIDFIIGGIVKLFLWANSHQEQVKRVIELQTKMKKLVEEKLGDKTKSMYYVDLLATRPELQGHGYGTALLTAVLFAADLRGRSVYLLASNTTNVPFYESFGFATIGEVTLGESNPKWDKPPVIAPLMVRKERGKN